MPRPLIGQQWSHDLDTSFWWVQSDHVTKRQRMHTQLSQQCPGNQIQAIYVLTLFSSNKFSLQHTQRNTGMTSENKKRRKDLIEYWFYLIKSLTTSNLDQDSRLGHSLPNRLITYFICYWVTPITPKSGDTQNAFICTIESGQRFSFV